MSSLKVTVIGSVREAPVTPPAGITLLTVGAVLSTEDVEPPQDKSNMEKAMLADNSENNRRIEGIGHFPEQFKRELYRTCEPECM